MTRLGFVRWYPFDLAVTSVAAVCAYAAITSFAPESPIRLLATAPLAVLLPGYAAVSVLFPAAARRDPDATEPVARPSGGIDVVERLGLSFVLSIALVATVTIGLAVTDWGLQPWSVAGSLAAITVAFAQIGVVRRLRTAEPERFSVAPLDAYHRLRAGDRVPALSSLVLVAAIGAAVVALGVGFLAPAEAGGFSELGLYTENGDGELVAGDLPDEVAPGESIPVTVEIENHEGERADYALVAQQQVLEDGDVVERTTLDEATATVPAGDAATSDHSVAPTASDGETVRIAFLLYLDSPPEEPSAANAEADTHFWVTVANDAGDG